MTGGDDSRIIQLGVGEAVELFTGSLGAVDELFSGFPVVGYLVSSGGLANS